MEFFISWENHGNRWGFNQERVWNDWDFTNIMVMSDTIKGPVDVSFLAFSQWEIHRMWNPMWKMF
jgi:hypothetical protein